MRLVVEVVSHKNTAQHMRDKLAFYERHGVPEYLVFDPQTARMWAYERRGGALAEVVTDGAWTSPFTGVRFFVDDDDLVAVDPTGRRWLDPEDEFRRADEQQRRADEQQRRADEQAAEVARLRALLE